jgi:uncharacterized damage-inducible protein DinB
MADFHSLFIADVKRRLIDESEKRINICLGELTEEEVWQRPNPQSNSVGNLILHLCGNARQWVVSGLGGIPDERNRDAEFAEQGSISKEELVAKLRQLMLDIVPVLDRLSPEDITKRYVIQGFNETGLSALIHVVEHFSYHVGQMAYFVKARKAHDLGFYRGLNLQKTNEGMSQ